ncbi:unnamed protein product [Brassica oleracea var. botrytis]|uniref:Uncharacterized protein n=1 Tax=Brassica cretica TaxID=69181 RepID=A0A8S9RX07_BRACR|nr:hypothetical protein F2Q69_00027348 [Brassica cretica]
MDVDLPPNEDVAQQDASNILYDLPYDSWVWGPHSGGWLAGWCLNMEHNCGLFMVSCSSICMRWALNHTWRLVTGLKYLPF